MLLLNGVRLHVIKRQFSGRTCFDRRPRLLPKREDRHKEALRPLYGHRPMPPWCLFSVYSSPVTLLRFLLNKSEAFLSVKMWMPDRIFFNNAQKKTRFIRFVIHQRSKNYRYANRYEIVTYVSRNVWSRTVMTNESIEDVWRSFTLLQITTDEFDSHRHNLNLNLWITPYLRNGEMLVTHLTRNLSHTKATFILHSWSWHLS
jgi:hypothetical protein